MRSHRRGSSIRVETGIGGECADSLHRPRRAYCLTRLYHSSHVRKLQRDPRRRFEPHDRFSTPEERPMPGQRVRILFYEILVSALQPVLSTNSYTSEYVQLAQFDSRARPNII